MVNRELDEASTRINSLSQEITDSLRSNALGKPLGKEDQRLSEICKGCLTVSEELVKVLASSRVQDGPNKKWKSFKKGVKSVWRKRELDDIVEKLNRYRSELDTYMLLGLK